MLLKDEVYADAAGMSAPARNCEAVTPNDNADLVPYAKALYIGTPGDVLIVPAGDESENPAGVLFADHPAGYLPVQVRRVMDAGSGAAENIVALYD